MGTMDAGRAVTEAIEAHVRADHERVVRIVAVACGSATTAEDAVQEAWHRALVHTARGNELDNVIGWVVVVATNLARSETRRWTRERRAVTPTGGSPPAVPPVDDLVDLRRAVAELALRQRQVVVLHYLLGFPVAEIARLLAVSDGNVKNALHRARATLAAALAVSEESR